MKIMLCIPTFILDHNPSFNDLEEITCRKIHLASFRSLVNLLEEEDSHEVYCALKNYNWRYSGFATPEKAVSTDWEEALKADHIIACPIIGESSSKGVHVEVGWATALGRHTSILIHQHHSKQSVMITGLSTNSDFKVKYFYYQNDPSTEIFAELREHLALCPV